MARSCGVRPNAAVSSCSRSSWMNPRTLSRMPASIGSNQASPANSIVPSAYVFVLFFSTAWSPPALKRRKWFVEQTRDVTTHPRPAE